MPYDEVWKKDPESYHDFDSLSAIALPLSSKLAMPPCESELVLRESWFVSTDSVIATNPNARRANTYPVVSAEAQHDYGSSELCLSLLPPDQH